MAMTITNWQSSNGKRWQDDTTYLGFDSASGLHRFMCDGAVGLFAKRHTPISGWQLIRGAYFYEFVRKGDELTD